MYKMSQIASTSSVASDAIALLSPGSPGHGLDRMVQVDETSDTSTDAVDSTSEMMLRRNSGAKSGHQAPSSWEKQLQSADERQEQLLDLKWNLVRQQMGVHAQEIAALQQELHGLRLDWSQQAVHNEDHVQHMREMKLQLQQDLSLAASHRRDLESHISLALTSISEEAQASLCSLQKDVTERSEAMERATRNFSVAEERIGSAFQFLSELNLVLEDEKKRRATCFDGLGQDLRALRIAHEDETGKRAARDEHIVEEARALTSRFDELTNTEASLRQAIQDVSSQVCREEKSRILACSKAETAMRTSLALWQEGAEERNSAMAMELQAVKEQVAASTAEQTQRGSVNIASVEALSTKMKTDIDLAFDLALQSSTKVDQEQQHREESHTALLARLEELNSDRVRQQTADRYALLEARFDATEHTSVQARLEELDVKINNRSTIGEEDVQRIVSSMVDSLRQQMDNLLLEQDTKNTSLEDMFVDLVSNSLANQKTSMEKNLEVERQRFDVMVSNQSRRIDELMDKPKAIDACVAGTRLSALEARDRAQAAASKEVSDSRWESLTGVINEYDARLSFMEVQDKTVRSKLREDRDALLVCCEALDTKCSTELCDHKETVDKMQAEVSTCVTSINDLQCLVREQAEKTGDNIHESIVAACAQELTHIQQLLARESEQNLSNHKALREELANEGVLREGQHERLRVYLTQDRVARDAEHATLQAHLNSLEKGAVDLDKAAVASQAGPYLVTSSSQSGSLTAPKGPSRSAPPAESSQKPQLSQYGHLPRPVSTAQLPAAGISVPNVVPVSVATRPQSPSVTTRALTPTMRHRSTPILGRASSADLSPKVIHSHERWRSGTPLH